MRRGYGRQRRHALKTRLLGGVIKLRPGSATGPSDGRTQRGGITFSLSDPNGIIKCPSSLLGESWEGEEEPATWARSGPGG